MSGRNILIALIVGIVLFLVYIAVKPNYYTPTEEQEVFARIRDQLKLTDVAEITMQAKEKDSDENVELKIKKENDSWILPTLYNYPAKSKYVDELLFALLEVGEERLEAESRESHPDYEVDEENGKKIVVTAVDKKELCNLVIGKSVPGDWKRCYVRIDDQDPVYSIRPNLSSKLKDWNLKKWAEQWLDKTLIDLDEDKGEEVVKVEVTRRDGDSFVLEKVEEEKVVEEPDKAEEKKAESADAKKKDASDKDKGEAEKKTEEKEKKKPKTVKETKWYVTTEEGRFEADSSKRSSFVSALRSISGYDPVKPAELASYGLDPAYLKIKITTEYTKGAAKGQRPKPYVLLVGDRVPEEEPKAEKKETAKKETAKKETAKKETEKQETAPPKAEAKKEKKESKDGTGPSTPAPGKKESTEKASSSGAEKQGDAEKEKTAPPSSQSSQSSADSPVNNPPAEKADDKPEKKKAEKKEKTANEEKKSEERKKNAPEKKKAEKEKKKPKLKTDRYVKIEGDPRFMTLPEWKFKSLDKKPSDFKPEKKKKETGKKKEESFGPPSPPSEKKTKGNEKSTSKKTAEKPAAEKPLLGKLGGGKKVSARHILISYKGCNVPGVTRSKEEARKKAEELLAQLKKDKSKFAELAKKWSDDKASKAAGGLMENFDPESMVPPFRDAVKKLKPGELSGVVETRYGFHIIERTK